MTREQIEKAAKEYADSIAQFDERKTYSREDFTAGAQCASTPCGTIDQKKADTSKELILMYSNGSARVTLLNPNLTFDGFLSVDMFIKWAYLDDLLPGRKEEAK